MLLIVSSMGMYGSGRSVIEDQIDVILVEAHERRLRALDDMLSAEIEIMKASASSKYWIQRRSWY